jgi:predicted hotdog family 3-hydroxylacyl-ACP dehydratase
VNAPPLLELIPHGPPMALLDAVVDHGPEHLSARMQVTATNPFADPDGNFPAWAGIELMAQAIAAYGGLGTRARGQPPRVGFLLGTRRYVSDCAALPAGTELLVTVRKLLLDEQGLGAFACSIECPFGKIVANLSVFQPEDPEQLLRQQTPA